MPICVKALKVSEFECGEKNGSKKGMIFIHWNLAATEAAENNKNAAMFIAAFFLMFKKLFVDKAERHQQEHAIHVRSDGLDDAGGKRAVHPEDDFFTLAKL